MASPVFRLAQATGFQGTPVPRPTYLSRPHPTSSAPTSVSVEIDWANYGAPTLQAIAISVPLIMGQAATAKLDSIRSVYIDNSFSDIPVYVYFPDSKYTVLAPPNSVVVQNVMTGTQEPIIYAEGFPEVPPLTLVVFTNVEMPPNTVSTVFDLPPVLQYIGYSQAIGTGPVLDLNVQLGAISTRKVNPMVIHWGRATGGPVVLDSVTINGLVMPIVVQEPSIVSGFTVALGTAIIYNKLPQLFGQATIRCTFSGGNSSFLAAETYKLTQHNDDDPVDNVGVTTNPAATNAAQSVTLGMPKASVSIYGAATTNNGGTALTMTNSTIDNDANISGTHHMGSSHYQAPIDLSNRAVGNTGCQLMGATWR